MRFDIGLVVIYGAIAAFSLICIIRLDYGIMRSISFTIWCIGILLMGVAVTWASKNR